ncbi:glycoside hydrolase family 97 protein [Mucilaginibacter sp. L3T2-6]|uniref:glycoside hydrolase family 97 protein n=1 Tax=Mucilaginibacter sp. L3T2-6 TaxID=3062491 RepID=UPI002674AF6E|nr:glycoside hydrolase family 97 protein [Mucilaginibacter sp. L3T2-6]MDO3641529.1 glycoside hydrolase family 97 protein [Mucilaginibacter sp. L3T2-6]MDV6214023.1 glycoside hydrolase family 97 protein [Mucilaginibacter sp. L3T2-6]
MMKRYLLTAFLLYFTFYARCTDTLSVCSPSGKICVKIWMDKALNYCVYEDNKIVLKPSVADMLLSNRQSFSSDNSIKSHTAKSVTNEIVSPVPEKRRRIKDDYNLLSITFRKPYKAEFRVYDDGVAYRFSTSFKDSITVQNEIASFHFPASSAAYFPAIHKRDDADVFHTSFEELYPLRRLDSIKDTEVGYTPVLVAPPVSPKIAIIESDLEDYPGMFLSGTAAGVLEAKFARYPLQEKLTAGDYPQMGVTERANYIAKTRGTRTFPWRVLMIAGEDKQLPGNDIVYRLASPTRIGDASWVHPGKATDEWIINVNLFNVPFKSGVNTASYKYYIDFAKRFGFDRIMMDAGWSDNTDLFKINPAINMDTIVAYAKAKNIKISMWTLAHTLNRQLDSALNRFNKWGVDFIMTDFIDRDDQKTVNFYYRIAKACAEHHIMIMYHGAYPPKGFNRTFPNNITREGVLGSEYNIWTDKVTPQHDVTLPFTRMLAGSFDYEPGILNNATQKGFRQIEGMVMSQGTRCHQLAMFVVYDNPMQIFSGNPSQAWLEPKFTELLGSIPTTWDETNILDGKVGEYIVTARQNGSNWFIAGMSNWTPRDITVNFDFLDASGAYKATICKDGVNADRYAADYILSDATVKKGDVIKIHLAPGGGFLVKLVKE